MADKGFEFYVPYEKFGAFLRDLGEGVKGKHLLKAMERTADLYEAEMVKLAPVRTGYLERSSVVRAWKNVAGVTAEIKFATDYAAQVHEAPPAARGPRTRAKPGTKFGAPGPKFVERVLKGMDLKYHMQRMMDDIMKRKG